MKTIKRLTAILLVTLIALTAFGCGAKEFTKESADALEAEVIETVKFQQKLTETPEAMLGSLYDTPEGVELKSYSAGYPADRFALFCAEDSAKIPEIKTMLEAKVQQLIDTYSSYDTTQVGKLENAIIETRGNYVIFIVTDDHENAKTVVGKY